MFGQEEEDGEIEGEGEDEEEEEGDENDLQLDGAFQEGNFEMMDDTLVHEDSALEMEQLLHEYKPHNVETIGLYSDDDESEEEPEDEENLQLSSHDDEKYFAPE